MHTILHKIRTKSEYYLYTSMAQLRLRWPKLFTVFQTRRSRLAQPRRLRLGGEKGLQKKLMIARILHYSAIAGLIAVVGGVVGFFGLFAYYSKDLPQPNQLIRRQGFSTRLYDRNGVLLYDLFDEERRVPIDIKDIPEALKQATIATEDKDFYKHKGFDFMTIVRIPYNFFVRKQIVGGSTLTQQLVKNALLTNERSLQRKFKELVLSMQIERKFTKDEILQMYLNEAPYGGNAWGVGTAAEILFNKHVSELTATESAVLAGLPQRPTAYSPLAGRTNENGELLWKIRTMGVLRRMQEDGYITSDEQRELLTGLEHIQIASGSVNIKAPHFVFYIRNLLEEQYGSELTERGGFKITTSLDSELQDIAQNIVSTQIDAVEETADISNGAVIAMDPRTGEILAMVGSRGYNSDKIDGKFNVAVDGLRQPGSAIKPVTYLAMIQNGYSPASMLVDVPTTFQRNENDKPYTPQNYDGRYRGPVSLRTSLGSSLNTTAVKGLAIVGIDHFLQLAYDLGFPTLQPSAQNKQRFGLAVTLGGAEVHLIDMVTAYSTFATGGKKIEPVGILKIEDMQGRVLYQYRPVEGSQIISQEEAFLINAILSDDAARAPAFGAGSLLNVNKNVAVKTGTTNDQRDNWAIGWSQEIMVGAWVGNNDNSPMKSVASGRSGATPLWRNVFLAVMNRGYGTPDWKVPDGVEMVLVDAISGYPEHDGWPARTDYFIKGTVPSLPDPIHTKLKLCRGEMKLANDARVVAGDYDEKEFIILNEQDPYSQDGKNRWMDGILAWIQNSQDERYKVPTEYCGEQSEIFVNLRRPEHEKKYQEEDIEVVVEADGGEGIEYIEIWVDGKMVEKINDRTYRGMIKMSAGQHEVYAKAVSRSGKEVTSRKARIGTGGQDWKAPDPTATPTPSPVPTATPTPPLPEPTIIQVTITPAP